tara:strand:- start:21 stop:293 length:273 start_codon:yes stop_codon:yes gene_type:complete
MPLPPIIGAGLSAAARLAAKKTAKNLAKNKKLQKQIDLDKELVRKKTVSQNKSLLDDIAKGNHPQKGQMTEKEWKNFQSAAQRFKKRYGK